MGVGTGISYHVIEPGGTVHSHEWTEPMELHCMPIEVIEKLIGCKAIEVIWVTWKGQRRAMFADELGNYKGLQPNAKATRIYMNKMFREEGLHDYVYEDLSESPMFKEEQLKANLQARVLIKSLRVMITGTVLLWEGELG